MSRKYTGAIYEGVSVSDENTLGGKTAENRGRRSASLESMEWERSPFEDGKIDNWNHRKGWEDAMNRRRQSANRKHGGSIIEERGHYGKGPKGYQRSDVAIFEDVCERLLKSNKVDARGIEVRVEAGIVSLEGTVLNRTMKKNAEYLAESISGVKDIQNRLNLQEDSYH